MNEEQKRYSNTIYLSTCTKDIKKYHQVAREILSDVDGWHCTYVSSEDDLGTDFLYKECARRIHSCDLLVALIGHLYGLRVPSHNCSLLQAELKLAEQLKKPMLLFVTADNFLIPANLRDKDDDWKKQWEFRYYVKDLESTIMFDSNEDFRSLITDKFYKWLRIYESNNRYKKSAVSRLKRIFVMQSNLTDAFVVKDIDKMDILSQGELYIPMNSLAALRSLSLLKFERSNSMTAQDITPFVPVIVEATKFLLGEVAKWIDDVRKKAQVQKRKHVISEKLATYKPIVINDSINEDEFAEFLVESITDADTYEINGLVNQIRLHRQVLSELENQEVLASGEELAKTKILIRERAKIVVEKTEELESKLERIYKD